MKEKKFSDFEIEEKTSGGAVFEQGVKQSKEHKAIRRIAQPLTDKHWLNTGQSVTQLHRIYRIAEYLLKRSKSCLLYTSPSPRDLVISRMPSSA